MYRKKNREKQVEEVKISLEKLVPENHILRAIDKAIDFSFIYEEVEGLYSEKGRSSIDPVSLFKIVFIQYLFGIRSMRQTIREIEVNNAYRWFIGYSLTEPVPHLKKIKAQSPSQSISIWALSTSCSLHKRRDFFMSFMKSKSLDKSSGRCRARYYSIRPSSRRYYKAPAKR